MEEKTDIVKKVADMIPSVDESIFNTFLDTSTFDQTWRAAQLLAKTDLLPAHFKNKPENCFLAFTMARQVGANPFTFMQKTYVIGGKLGMEAQLIISLVNSRGPFTGPIQWRMKGDFSEKGNKKEWSCTAYATHKLTGEICEATVSWAMVEAEGWSKKAGSKWLTMPEIMFRYRSASFLASLYCPEVKFGMPTAEELEDIDGQPKPEKQQAVSPLEERLRKKVESTQSDPVVPEQKTPEPTTPDPELAELDSFTQKPEPKAAVQVEERYVCRECDWLGAKLGGLTGNLCPACGSDKIIDRWKKTQ